MSQAMIWFDKTAHVTDGEIPVMSFIWVNMSGFDCKRFNTILLQDDTETWMHVFWNTIKLNRHK